MAKTEGVIEGKGLVELVSKATVDPEFRARVLSDPAKYAAEYQLSTNDALAFKNITASQFEQAAAGMSERPQWTIGIGFYGHFDAK